MYQHADRRLAVSVIFYLFPYYAEPLSGQLTQYALQSTMRYAWDRRL